MITTYKELLQATLAKYERAQYLSRQESMDGATCTYSAQRKGQVGCAIGCHLDPDKALILDGFEGDKSIETLFDYYVDQMRSILGEVIDIDAIGIDNLAKLQLMHDGSVHVEEFRRKLIAAIARIE